MTQIDEIKCLLLDNDIWDGKFQIKPNRNIRGQSISYFVYDETDKTKYIVKFFDFFKDIIIPDSVNINSCNCAEELIEKLYDADDFIGDINEVADFIYYRKRSFTRYIQVCKDEDVGFPKIYAVNEDLKIGQHYYGVLVEEAIQGVTLEEFFNKLGKKESRDDFAIDFLWKLSIIVGKYIKHGIVHRDISPDNIMISKNEFIVIDPGMVKIVARNSTEFGYVMGKRNYASPEQYFGYAMNADFTSDLYSIGLIAFEIISGENPLALYINKGCTKPHEELLNKYDRELEDIFFDNIDETERNQQLFLILRKMLQVDKLNRFDDIFSFQEALKVLKEEI